MAFSPLSLVWTRIRSSNDASETARLRAAYPRYLSFYRYDSTGRIVHYGPGGVVLEDDSTFRIKDVQTKRGKRTKTPR